MNKIALSIVHQPLFEHSIIALILLNAAILGLETNPALVASYGSWFELGHHFILTAFIIEAALKITAVSPRLKLYFGDGWNLFDFSVIVLALIPATGELAVIARLARLLRVLRLISTIPELRLIVTTLMRSIPSMGHVILLMSIIFYIYAIAGYHLFHLHDPTHWETLGLSLLTLFRVVTLEDWTDVMYTAMEAYEWAWIYFVSFVFMGTFVIINLFIAVVLNNLEQSKAEQLKELRNPVSRDELLDELATTQQALARLRERMERLE
jgi:voltage-gated sodium channel